MGYVAAADTKGRARENVVAGEDEKGNTGDRFACSMESCLGAQKKDTLMRLKQGLQRLCLTRVLKNATILGQ